MGNLFDILGPVMVGPSSSHTAGAARIGLIARQLFGRQPDKAVVNLHGSFAATGKGHGTDRAIEETLKSSPLIYLHKESKRFKILRDYIQFNLTESRYYPLNYSSSRMDGKLPNVFLADEVGALPNPYAIESMRSGQLNILNKLGFIISTKYPTNNFSIDA